MEIRINDAIAPVYKGANTRATILLATDIILIDDSAGIFPPSKKIRN